MVRAAFATIVMLDVGASAGHIPAMDAPFWKTKTLEAMTPTLAAAGEIVRTDVSRLQPYGNGTLPVGILLLSLYSDAMNW